MLAFLFCTVVQQLTIFKLTQSAVHSLSNSWAACWKYQQLWLSTHQQEQKSCGHHYVKPVVHTTVVFLGLPGWPVPEEKLLLDFMVQLQGKITEAYTPTIWLVTTSCGLISDPPPSYSHFYAGCPSCCNSPIYPDLGQAPNMTMNFWPRSVVIHCGSHGQPLH